MKKSSGLNQERNLHRSSSVYKQKQSKTVLHKYVWILIWETTGDGLFHWTKHYYSLWTRILAKVKLKRQGKAKFGLEWCGLLVDYCDVFISCLDSHSDGTHSLQRIHCWDSDVKLHFSKSDEETNSSTSWMVWGWGHISKC